MLFSNQFAKPNGFSLIELMIAAGLSFLVVLSSAYLIEGMLGQDRAMKGAMTAEAQLDQADFIVQRYFRSAVDLQQTAGPIASTSTLSGMGSGVMLNSFDSDTAAYAGNYQAIVPLALFYRDTAVVPSSPGPSVSVLKPTGVYFQQPGPTTYGVLYIDDGANGTTLAPNLNNVVADHIIRLAINNVTTTLMPVGASPPRYVRSFQMTVDLRMPLYTNSSGSMTWCGPYQTGVDAACANSLIPHKDTERIITVIVYDNMDPNAVPADARLWGAFIFHVKQKSEVQMKNLKHVLSNQNGLSLIPVLMVSMVMASVLSVWMIQMSNKSASNGAEWVQKENFRIGTELAKLVAGGYEIAHQNGGACPTGTQTMRSDSTGLTFCFAPPSTGTNGSNGPSNSMTGACVTSPMLPASGQVCLKSGAYHYLKKFVPGVDETEKMPTLFAVYQPAPKFSWFLSTAHAAPLGAPAPNAVTAIANNVTPITCTAANSNMAGSLCKQCDVGSFKCYQLAYCTVSDPTCAGGASSTIKMGVILNTN